MKNKKKVLEEKELKTKALEFIITPRGWYIIGQALHIAIETLRKVPSPYTELSNISDMEFLEENLFSLFKNTHIK